MNAAPCFYIVLSASTIYIHSTPEAMEEAGVYDDTIRISVGIEDIKDLIKDFTEAVESLGEELSLIHIYTGCAD